VRVWRCKTTDRPLTLEWKISSEPHCRPMEADWAEADLDTPGVVLVEVGQDTSAD
jgi:hypothetical protein